MRADPGVPFVAFLITRADQLRKGVAGLERRVGGVRLLRPAERTKSLRPNGELLRLELPCRETLGELADHATRCNATERRVTEREATGRQ
jgi:hypothetical protein